MNRKHLWVLVLAMALLGVGAPASARPLERAAAPGCTWDACSGKDPAAMGCLDDKRLLYDQGGGGYMIWLYYSEACRAAWGETTYHCPSSECYLQLWYTEPFGYAERAHVARADTPRTRTLLSSWNNSVKACLVPTASGATMDPDPQGLGTYASGQIGACTRWY